MASACTSRSLIARTAPPPWLDETRAGREIWSMRGGGGSTATAGGGEASLTAESCETSTMAAIRWRTDIPIVAPTFRSCSFLSGGWPVFTYASLLRLCRFASLQLRAEQSVREVITYRCC